MIEFFEQLQLNPLALSLLVPAIVSFILWFEASKRQNGVSGKIFSYAMLSVIVWSVAYGFELASTRFEMLKLCLKVEYLAIPYVTTMMLLVIYQILDKENGLPYAYARYLFIIPFVTMVLAVTNDYHHFFYKDVSLDTSGLFPTLKLTFGLWYYVHVAYAYILVITGLVLLIKRMRSLKSYFLYQRIAMIIGVLSPMIVFSVYFIGLMPVKNIDPTPFAFTLSGLAFSVSILKYRMLTLVPVARDHVFHSMVDGIVVLDISGKIIDCNPSGMAIFKWDKMPVAESVFNLWADKPDLTQLIRNKDYETIEIEILRNSELHSYIVSSATVLNRKKINVGISLSFHENTIRKQLLMKIQANEQILAKLNAEKDKLFAILSHDLRSPVNSYVSLTDMFIDESFDLSLDEIRVMAKSMNKSARSLSELLENLLEWAKMQRGNFVIRKESIFLGQIVNHALEVLKEMFSNKEIDLKIDIEKSLTVNCDVQLLKSIIRNLATNAFKFTPRKGKVIIAAEDLETEFIQISIRDTGIGIRKELIGKLFQIENEVGRPGTEGESSSGLGLLLCKDFVEKQGGKIWVESEETVGTTFYFTLPKST